MKNSKLLMTCIILLSVSVIFTGCSNKASDSTNSVTTSNTDTTSNSTANTTSSNTDTATSSVDTTATTADGSSSSQTFTVDELKTYNGQNGNPAYVAVDGSIYDVSNAKEWNNGSHQGLSAGEDLTSVIANSPHGDSVLADLPVVGTLE